MTDDALAMIDDSNDDTETAANMYTHKLPNKYSTQSQSPEKSVCQVRKFISKLRKWMAIFFINLYFMTFT